MRAPTATGVTATAVLALIAAAAIASPSANALPLAKGETAARSSIELVAQKNRDDDAPRATKKKSQDAASKTKSKDRDLRYGSRAPGVGVPVNVRGSYLYSPSFNGTYTPPAGYSFNGYPVRRAEDIAAARSECSAARRRGQQSEACTEDD
jgi:hypothetical protein